MSPAVPERVAPPDADRILAAEYVLGTLDSEDRRRVRARCAAEPQFAALVRLWERRLAPLHELAVPVIPAPDIWRAIASDLRSAPPALRGATLPRGLSPSPDPPRRPAMPEGRPLRSAERTGEGAVARVRRLFGFAPGRRAEPGRAEPARGAERPARRRAFPPLDPAPSPVALSPDLAAPDGRTLGGAIRDVRAAGLLPQVTAQMTAQVTAQVTAKGAPQVAPQALPRAETGAAARLPEPAPPLTLAPPPPRPRPAPEPLTPPPAFMFLEPDTPPEPEPAPVEAAGDGAGAAAPPQTEERGGTAAAAEPVATEQAISLAAPASAPEAASTPPPEPIAPAPAAPPAGGEAPAAVTAGGGGETAVASAPPVAPAAGPVEVPQAETRVADTALADTPVADTPAADTLVPDVAPAGNSAAPGLAEAAPVVEAAPDVAEAKAEPDTGGPAPPSAIDAVSMGTSGADAPSVDAPSVEPPSADPDAGGKGEEAPLPGWAAEVASGEVSALPDEPAAPARIVVRHGPWRGISLLLALLCLGLGGLAAYREWIWPGEGYWVAVMQPEPVPAVSVRIDPDSGAVHVRSFAPAPPEGETYRLWLVSPASGARLIGAFSSGLSERRPELARLGRKGLAGTELVVTREPVEQPDAGRGPGEAVVYRGRLVPE